MSRAEMIESWKTLSNDEKNEMVAELIFGKSVRMLNEVTNGSFKPQYDRKVIDLGGCRYNNIPRFIEDLNEAWLVIDAIKVHGYTPTINIVSETHGSYQWRNAELGDYHCCFSKEPTIGHKRAGHIRGHAKTAAEAICLAGLLVKLNEGSGRA